MIAYKEVKSILNKHKKRGSWFLDDYSINPYEGWGFKCTYCYVQVTNAEKIFVDGRFIKTTSRRIKSPFNS